MHVLRVFRLLFTAILMFFWLAAFAQQGSLKIIEDPRADSLIRVQISPFNHVIKGYRILLASENSKVKIQLTRNEFISTHPKVPTYVAYEAPNFVLKVGNFQFKEEALALNNQLKKFPYSFIIEEMVNYHPK